MSIKQRERGLSFYNQDIPEVEEDDESSSSEEEFDFCVIMKDNHFTSSVLGINYDNYCI